VGGCHHLGEVESIKAAGDAPESGGVIGWGGCRECRGVRQTQTPPQTPLQE